MTRSSSLLPKEPPARCALPAPGGTRRNPVIANASGAHGAPPDLTRRTPPCTAAHLPPAVHDAAHSRHGSPFRFQWAQAAQMSPQIERAWDDLAADALEPNVFHERWMLQPALQAFADPERTALLLAWDATRPARLCGLFPLERSAGFRGLPLPHWRLWRHKHCYLGTPLLRPGAAQACIAALLQWLATHDRRATLMEWELLAAAGPVHAALAGAIAGLRLPAFESRTLDRALLVPRANAESFLGETLTGKALRELRRMRRRLAERGELRTEVLADPALASQWIVDFLELEARGWKGRRGSALASEPAGRQFFVEAAGAAAQRGQLLFMRLCLDGRPIAMKCTLLAGDGAFAFKIAYDEAHARYSPGMLLELDHVHEFHRRSELRWLDWCAEPAHFMANRLSLDRRRLVSVVSALPRPGSRMTVHCLPALRWCRRKWREWQQSGHPGGAPRP